MTNLYPKSYTRYSRCIAEEDRQFEYTINGGDLKSKFNFLVNQGIPSIMHKISRDSYLWPVRKDRYLFDASAALSFNENEILIRLKMVSPTESIKRELEDDIRKLGFVKRVWYPKISS